MEFIAHLIINKPRMMAMARKGKGDVDGIILRI